MISNRFNPLGVSLMPYDAEVESLLSKNDAYIVTDIIPQAQDIIRCKYLLSERHGAGGPFKSAYGAWDANPNYWLTIKSNGNMQLWAFSPVDWCGGLPPLGTIIDVEVNLKEKTVTTNGNVSMINSVGVPHPDQPPITLFSISNQTKRDCTIFSFSVVRDGKTICDIIPVRKGDVGYMFDRISGKLFGNQGTGAFVLGADK